MSENELYHYGVKGMKWGVRRYQRPDGSLTPAGKERYSSSSDNSDVESTSNKKTGFHLTDRQKTALKIGVAVAGTGLAIYGGYRLYKALDPARDPNFDMETGLIKKSADMSSLEDSIAVNETGFETGMPFYRNNCSFCSATYDLRRRGYDVKAGPGMGANPDFIMQYFKGSEPISTGASAHHAPFYGDAGINDAFKAQTQEFINAISAAKATARLDPVGFRHSQQEHMQKIVNTCQAMGPNARGHIMVWWSQGGGHSLQFETDSKGVVHFIDSQVASLRMSETDYFNALVDNVNPYVSSVVTRTDNLTPNYDFLRAHKIVRNPLTFNPTEDDITVAKMGVAGAALAIATGQDAANSIFKNSDTEDGESK